MPYEATEVYIDQESYQGFEDVEIPLKYEHQGRGEEGIFGFFGVKEKGIVLVKNVDSETGYFKINMEFETLEDGKHIQTTGGYVQPGETREFTLLYDIDEDVDVKFTYSVNPGKKR